MDDFEKVLRDAEKEGISMANGLSRLLMGMWKSAQDDLKSATEAARRLRVISIIASIISVVCLASCIYMGSELNRQRGEIASIHKILEQGVVIEEKTTTTETTTIEQGTGEGSGNNVYQAGDNSNYTQNGDGE